MCFSIKGLIFASSKYHITFSIKFLVCPLSEYSESVIWVTNLYVGLSMVMKDFVSPLPVAKVRKDDFLLVPLCRHVFSSSLFL